MTWSYEYGASIRKDVALAACVTRKEYQVPAINCPHAAEIRQDIEDQNVTYLKT